jgi:hypothetical protein
MWLREIDHSFNISYYVGTVNIKHKYVMYLISHVIIKTKKCTLLATSSYLVFPSISKVLYINETPAQSVLKGYVMIVII